MRIGWAAAIALIGACDAAPRQIDDIQLIKPPVPFPPGLFVVRSEGARLGEVLRASPDGEDWILRLGERETYRVRGEADSRPDGEQPYWAGVFGEPPGRVVAVFAVIEPKATENALCGERPVRHFGVTSLGGMKDPRIVVAAFDTEATPGPDQPKPCAVLNLSKSR